MREIDILTFLLDLSPELKATYDLYQDLLFTLQTKNLERFNYLLKTEHSLISHEFQTAFQTFKTYTVDRGKEFACYCKIEDDLKVPIYFADAYSSWQRGSNENANGLLRKFFPKKTDLARVTEEEVNEALCLINHRPRKCLGSKTSFELFHEKLSQLY